MSKLLSKHLTFLESEGAVPLGDEDANGPVYIQRVSGGDSVVIGNDGNDSVDESTGYTLTFYEPVEMILGNLSEVYARCITTSGTGELEILFSNARAAR